MVELLSENVLFIIIALVIGVVVAWWIFSASRKTTIEREAAPGDGLATGAKRNQALIDAAPAASPTIDIPPPTPEGLAGIGTVVAAEAEPVHMAPPPPLAGDDLKKIKGLGPKVEKLLHEMGVTSFAQIAAWDDAEVARIDAALGAFAGRIVRDDWRTQARLLAAGDSAGYEDKFGKL
ncbi:hypothetical protein GRI89_07745 [Altererythrobacter salegens]|uniref:Uncharacterized protein n=2 Tax=Croceibacterium salegens TaxID=1737568 RepID=A0A6I4SYT4_9SPHN|nr:hypothetical protein [Croceibacterium salegens]